MRAKITKISRSSNNPQIDVEVYFSDEKAELGINRVISYGDLSLLENDPKSIVEKEVRRIAEEFLNTLDKETFLKKELEGLEIDF